MRKTLYIILCIAAVAAFTACNSDEVEGYIPSPELMMIDGDGNISVSGSSTDAPKEMRIITNGRWTIEVAYDGEAMDWLELSETGGTGEKTVTLRPTAINPSASEPRTATLTIASVNTGLKQRVRVTQGGSVETLSLNSDVQTFDINGGRYVVSVTCNSAWTVTGEQDWCTVDKTEGVGNGQVSVTVAPSTQGSDRSTDLTFTSGERTAKITIRQTQYVSEFSVNHTERHLAATGGEDILRISSDTDWSVTSNSGWLSASAQKGSGNGEVVVTAAPIGTIEGRTGTVTFRYEQAGVKKEMVCTYIQAGGHFNVSPDRTTDIKADGGTMEIAVDADIQWTVASNDNWLSLSTQGGNGEAKVTVTAQANQTTEMRTGTVTFMYDNGKTRQCTFTQQGQTVLFSVSPEHTSDLSALGATATIKVNASGYWTLSSSDSWLKPDKTSGSGNGEVTVTADKNTSTSERSATITFTYTQYGKTVTAVCTFTQDAGKAPDNWGDNTTPEYSKRK